VILRIVLLLLVMSAPAFALEKDYQKKWCDNVGGKMEVVLKDGARVDCVTRNYAVEFDFAHKWSEAVGQSLYYAIRTGKKPGVVLICGPNDNVFVTRMKAVAKKHGIRLWRMEAEE